MKKLIALSFFVSALFLSIPNPADALSAVAQAGRENPFIYASRLTGVPLKLLAAVAKVESGYQPLALNVGGASVFPKSYSHARAVLGRVGSNVDIGLMQVNYGIWGKRLNLSKETLLDPHTNVLAGAYILKRLLRQYPLWEAVGRYNSTKRYRQVGYAWKVYRELRRWGVR